MVTVVMEVVSYNGVRDSGDGVVTVVMVVMVVVRL